jgi:lipopolysaccharide transport system permease protein
MRKPSAIEAEIMQPHNFASGRSSESTPASELPLPLAASAELPPTASTQPWIVIQPSVGWQGLRLRELWQYRDLLYLLAWRDIKVRYKQTVLGAAWALIQPLLTMVVFTVFFGRLGGMDRQVEQAYPLFSYAGILPWMLFSTVVSQASLSMLASTNLITKVYFPRLVIPLASAGAPLVDLGVSFLMMVLLMIVYAATPSASIILLPLLVLITTMAALGMGTLLAALVVSYRDFRYVIPFLIQLWLFASPVAYPYDEVPAEWRLLYALNPLAGMISGFRSALLGESLHVGPLVVSTLASMAVFVLGITVFCRLERRFADVV